MCGIAGIYSYRIEASPVDRDELLRIRDQMIKRGPDGAGLWISPDQRIGLAHRRLAIIDLSETGAQPMATFDGRLRITFNGEIYNHLELRRELEGKGYRFHSTSDTEVLLNLYADRGEDMVHALRGMYAFAIWDETRKSLFLARDPFGIKPLYYAEDGKSFRFASQVKALLAGGQIDTAPEPAGHAGFFLWGSVPEPWTLYRGIRNLPAGHFLRVTQNGAGQATPYCLISDILCDAADNPATGSRAEALEVFVEAFRDSIRAHQVADVPVGLFLSAGLDSAMIASVATASGDRPHSMTLAFAEFSGTESDEAPQAEQLAARLGTRHATIMVRKADFMDDRERLLAAMDQPSVDGVNTWFVARAATSQGIKVALSGLGGDELLASYPSFNDLPRINRLAGRFAGLPSLGPALRRFSAPMASRLTSPKYAGLLEYGATLGGAYLLRRGLYMPWELPDVLDADMAQQGLRELQTVDQLNATFCRSPPITPGQSRLPVSALEMSWYMRNQLLRDSDWASMAQSMEVRVPFLDIPLLKAVAPWLAAYPGLTKPEIASAIAPKLPAVLIDRPKTGFSIPLRQWLDNDQCNQGERGLRTWARYIYKPYEETKSIAKTTDGLIRKHRILLLTTDSFGGHGGIAFYNRCLAKALSEMPEVDEVVVLARTMRFAPEAVPKGVRFVSESTGGKLRYMREALALTGERFDLIICGHINLLPLAAPFAKLKSVPLVLQVHGIDVWEPSSATSKFWLKSVDEIWTVSSVTRDRMNSWARLPHSRYTIIPNTIHIEQFGMGAKRADLVARYGLEGRKVIMTLARLVSFERYKGIDETLEVLPDLLQRDPNLIYMILGDGNDQSRLEAKSRMLGVSGNVIFAGYVKESDKSDYLRLADVFVLPGRGEGFGIVYLEAMACGIPVVGSKSDGSRDALRDGMLGELVDPTDLQSIAQGILRALAKAKGVPDGLAYFAWPSFKARVAKATRSLAS